MIKEITVKDPMWKTRSVGINESNLKYDKLLIKIDYRNKEGKLEFPYLYEATRELIKKSPTMKVANGTVTLWCVPIDELTELELREKPERGLF